MGQKQSENYKSKEGTLYDKITNPNAVKTKRDGTILKPKAQIV